MKIVKNLFLGFLVFGLVFSFTGCSKSNVIDDILEQLEEAGYVVEIEEDEQEINEAVNYTQEVTQDTSPIKAIYYIFDNEDNETLVGAMIEFTSVSDLESYEEAYADERYSEGGYFIRENVFIVDPEGVLSDVID